MSRLCGKNEVEIAVELSGVIFRVPGEERYATADEYLSGNVREKLREAEAAAKADPSFNVNVESLRAAQPRELTASEIDVRLGATWIEPRCIEQFMVETFQPTYWASRSMSVNYSFHAHLSDLERQVENAREELEKPFPQEDELREKSARLVELNAELDMENNSEPPEAEKPSVLAKLKEPIPLYEPKTAPSKEACR